MDRSFDVEYTPPFFEAVARRRVRRVLPGILAFAGVGILLSVVGYACSGALGPVLQFLLPVIALAVFWVIVAYSSVRRSLQQSVATWSKPQSTVRLSDEGFSSRSDSGYVETAWHMIIRAELYPEVIFLFPQKHLFVALPGEPFDEEARAFIRERVTTAGGVVREGR